MELSNLNSREMNLRKYISQVFDPTIVWSSTLTKQLTALSIYDFLAKYYTTGGIISGEPLLMLCKGDEKLLEAMLRYFTGAVNILDTVLWYYSSIERTLIPFISKDVFKKGGFKDKHGETILEDNVILMFIVNPPKYGWT